MQVWSRHSHHSIAIFGAYRNLEHLAEYVADLEQGLPFDSFFELLVGFHSPTEHHTSAAAAGWMTQIRSHAKQLITQIEKGPPQDNLDLVNALLNLCAEFSFDLLFERLSLMKGAALDVSIATQKKYLVWSMGVSDKIPKESLTYQETCWARGFSPLDDQLEAALERIPMLKGLAPLSSLATEQQQHLHASTCKLLQLASLEKWCQHRVFRYMSQEDGVDRLQTIEMDLLYESITMVSTLSAMPLLRFEAKRLVVEAELEQLRLQVSVERHYLSEPALTRTCTC